MLASLLRRARDVRAGLPSRRALAATWLLSGVVAGALSYALGQSKNLLLFRHASEVLLAGGDPYAARFLDDFKYSPTFALLFAPLAWMPAAVAAVLWSAGNFAVAFAGLDAAFGSERGDDEARRVAMTVALAGVLLATDGDQSNLLVTGLVLLAFASLERGRVAPAAVAIALATHVKLFPLAACGFALLRPRPGRALLAIGAAVLAASALPLLVASPGALARDYVSWAQMLARDHQNHGWSVMSLASATGLALPQSAIQIAGALALAWPLVAARGQPTSRAFRRTYAASVLAFVVLFNHRAEYATYVVSAVGVGLFYAAHEPTPARRALVALAIVAHGPLLAAPDPSVTGPLALLAAHRLFHPLRVVPLAATWALMNVDLAALLRARRPSTAAEARRAERSR